ncbi:MAG: nucleotidyltransferase [Acidimicrobiia bacterium]|nr:nucleotidyltransferase [Acidimicrobiia bacterium]
MRMTASFNAFMTNTVNINQTRIDNLDVSVPAIFDALQADSEIGSIVLDYDPQGSWPHGTIIKPADGVEFDADFMLVMDEQEAWAHSPKTYITVVHAALARNGTYKDLVKPPKCRCVRVVYAGDYHVDVVPFVVLSDGRQVIVNGDGDEWEDTDPAGFTAWMKEKNDTTGGHLKRVIRLLKYLRDHRDSFRRTRSVLLTAMLGERVDAASKIADPSYYEDLPTTFFHLITDLNEWLQANPTKPSIADPSGATDPDGNPITFDHRWTEDTYQAFRKKISSIAADTKVAYEDDTSIEHSLELWQKVFGLDFKLPATSSGGGSSNAGTAGAGLAAVGAGRGG